MQPGSGAQAGFASLSVRLFDHLDGQRFVLCIDEAFRDSTGGPRPEAADADGKPTAYVDNTLKLLQDTRPSSAGHRILKKVRELDLLEPMQAQVEMRSGEPLPYRPWPSTWRSSRQQWPTSPELAKTT